jgi:hypothetical protein
VRRLGRHHLTGRDSEAPKRILDVVPVDIGTGLRAGLKISPAGVRLVKQCRLGLWSNLFDLASEI